MSSGALVVAAGDGFAGIVAAPATGVGAGRVAVAAGILVGEGAGVIVGVFAPHAVRRVATSKRMMGGAK